MVVDAWNRIRIDSYEDIALVLKSEIIEGCSGSFPTKFRIVESERN